MTAHGPSLIGPPTVFRSKVMLEHTLYYKES